MGAAGGNGGGNGQDVDLGMVYGLLQNVSTRLTAIERSLHDIERRLDVVERRLETAGGDVASLRQTVAGYHASVVGHGILITELDERLRRIERRLDLGAPS